MKSAIRLTLPPLTAYFCGRRPSVMARAAHRRGNAAGMHENKARQGRRERRRNRLDERDARLISPHPD